MLEYNPTKLAYLCSYILCLRKSWILVDFLVGIYLPSTAKALLYIQRIFFGKKEIYIKRKELCFLYHLPQRQEQYSHNQLKLLSVGVQSHTQHIQPIWPNSKPSTSQRHWSYSQKSWVLKISWGIAWALGIFGAVPSTASEEVVKITKSQKTHTETAGTRRKIIPHVPLGHVQYNTVRNVHGTVSSRHIPRYSTVPYSTKPLRSSDHQRVRTSSHISSLFITLVYLVSGWTEEPS